MSTEMQLMAKTSPELSFTPVQARKTQRKQSWKDETDNHCPKCRKGLLNLQRISATTAKSSSVPPIVHEVLNSPGEPLDPETRAFMEPRFGHDFSNVRVHTDAKATESAQAVNALAYTIGSDIVFTQEHYQPATIGGRQLLTHELAHVVQQHGAQNVPSFDRLTLDPPHSDYEKEAQRIAVEVGLGSTESEKPPAKTLLYASAPIISRADPEATKYTMRLGTTPKSGVRFWPTNVTDTRVGPVSVQGGLLSSGASRLNVIIGENLSMRTLARMLLPLWTTTTPFTPPGAAAPLPLDVIKEDDLAKGLMVYNQYYLPVPAMTRWRSGLLFPLPVELDEATGVATLHPTQIRMLAGTFDPTWLPLLDLRAGATATPPAATLNADVAAFLARETTPLARGVNLGVRAITDAVAELPFIRETFRQLGAASFDVALAFMDNFVNRDIGRLAAQWEGAAILTEIRTALAAVPPAPTATQLASLNRANLMLSLVAGVAAEAHPSAARTRTEKAVTIDTVKLNGSTHSPAADVAVANGILSQCNVRLVHGVDETATEEETKAWLGGNTDLSSSSTCGSVTAEQRRLFQGATARFGLTARIRAFFPATISGIAAAGYAFPPYCATDAAAFMRDTVFLSNVTGREDLAHEVGHILLNSDTHLSANIMSPYTGHLIIRLTDPQCKKIHDKA